MRSLWSATSCNDITKRLRKCLHWLIIFFPLKNNKTDGECCKNSQQFYFQHFLIRMDVALWHISFKRPSPGRVLSAVDIHTYYDDIILCHMYGYCSSKLNLPQVHILILYDAYIGKAVSDATVGLMCVNAINVIMLSFLTDDLL